MYCDKRSRTGGLNSNTWSPEIELISCARLQVVFVVCDHDLESTNGIYNWRIGIEVQQILAEARSSINADKAGVSLSVIASDFQSLPGTLKKETVLRIQNFGFSWAKIKKRSIKEINVL